MLSINELLLQKCQSTILGVMDRISDQSGLAWRAVLKLWQMKQTISQLKSALFHQQVIINHVKDVLDIFDSKQTKPRLPWIILNHKGWI